MDPELISVFDAAAEVGMGKQGVFKVLRRLGIDTVKKHNSNHGGQAIAYITANNFERLRREIGERPGDSAEDRPDAGEDLPSIDIGVFYLIQLEPEHDAGRFKVGFAANMPERLRAHRCSAPFATVIKEWPCKRKWEGTAIDCVTSGCDQLHTEVFRTNDIESVVGACDEFFKLMPSPQPRGSSERET